MIRFSAGLVVVAIGVLIGGVATSKLSLVYVAIAVSAVALVALAIGVALKRDELFGGGPEQAPADAGAGSGMPVGQSADTGHVRGNNGPVRADQAKIRPKGPATAAFEAAAAAKSEAAPTVATPSVTTPPVTAVTVAAPPVVSSPLGQRQPAFSQASTREGDSAADWQTRSPQPPWSSGDQGRSTWTPKETQSAPAPAAASPRGWGSSDEPPSPSWFDRLNQPVADSPAPTAGQPSKPEQPKPEPSTAGSSSAGSSEAESAKTEPSKTPPAAEAVDADDDDWPTRYSWLDDDESDEMAKPDADVADATDATNVAETVSAETMPAKTVPAEAKAAEPDAASPDDATTTADADADAPTATADDDQPAEPSAPRGRDVTLVTVIPGVPRYHDPDCILIRFMDDEDVARKSIPEAKAANCTPCAACQPEG